MSRSKITLLACVVAFGVAARVQAQPFTYAADNGAITITGYSGPGGDVTIPDVITGLPVTSIASYAFWNATNLTGVTLGNSLTNVWYDAFASCINLRSITVEPFNPVYSSLEGVLFDKSQSTLLRFPAGRSGSYHIPRTVTSIGTRSFSYSGGLTNVTIPSNVTNIGNVAFLSCASLTDVTVPDRVTRIGDGTFWLCSSLISVTYAESVTSIGDAFFNCRSLTNFTVHTGVTNIDANAFDSCFKMTGISVDPLNETYSSLEGVLFDKNQKTLVRIPNGKTGSYAIPNSVTRIEAWALAYCNGLSNVEIPTSVISIGDLAFTGCLGLTNLIVPSGVTSIGDESFSHCFGLRRVTLPSTVARIGWGTFVKCTNLIDVTIANGLTSISDEMFSYCSGLTNVTIPRSVSSVGTQAFSYCSTLNGIYFQGNAPTLGSDVFKDTSPTVYYLPGTTGWDASFGGLPTSLWTLPNSVILNNSVGVRENQFGFRISWTTNNSVVVEASTSLTNPLWTPVATNALLDGTSYFTDSHWKKSTNRFYRLRSP